MNRDTSSMGWRRVSATMALKSESKTDPELTHGNSGYDRRPGFVVRQFGRRAVDLETEYGRNAVRYAKSLLGEKLLGWRRELTEAIAVGINENCKI